GRALDGIDPDTFHRRQIDHQAALAYGIAGDVVAAALDRHQYAVGAGEAHRRHDVGDPGTAGDQRRTPVDHAVPDYARRVVARVAVAQQWTAQIGGKLLDGWFLEEQVSAFAGDDAQIGHGSLPDVLCGPCAVLSPAIAQPLAGGFQIPRSCISLTCRSMTSRL